VAEVGKMAIRSTKSIPGSCFGAFGVYGVGIDGAHYFKKPLKINEAQKDNTFD
jgi:hypothetical protein